MTEEFKSRIIEASKTGAEAKAALEKLFPEVFENNKYINTAESENGKHWIEHREGGILIAPRGRGNYEHKGYYLHPNFDWKIVVDDEYEAVLVPMRKQGI